jgi:hypothetical protein
VEVQALAGPDPAEIVVFGGPYAEVKEVLAGYQLVDVDSEARPIELAARVSAAPGPGAFRCGNGSKVACR